MEKHQLSKSTFIRGLQCLKSLYLYKNRYFLRDRLSAEQLAKFRRGTDVGIFAQDLFPGGVDCKPKSPSQYRKSVEKTANLVFNNKAEVIYEAAFQYDGVLILLDILVKNGNQWDAYEVKSSLKISETYLHDAALQYYVLTHAGVDIGSFYLTHLNPEYTTEDTPVLKNMFSFADVTDEAKSHRDFIAKQIVAQKQAIALKSSPQIDIGTHCHNPYPCDFIGHCWKHVPEKSLFGLAGWSEDEKFDLYNKGFRKVDEITDKWINSPHKQIEMMAYKSGKDHFDENAYKAFSEKNLPQAGCISFLGYKRAIPVWKGYRPYNTVPVAFGLQKGAGEEQYIFMNQDVETAPDLDFIRFLDVHLSNLQSLIIYDGTQFLTMISEMRRRNPAYAELLDGLMEKVVDYQEVFLRFIFFSAKTGNDFSLANVVEKLLGTDGGTNISRADEVEAVNVFLKTSGISSVSPGEAYISEHLKATAGIWNYLENTRS